MKRLVVLGVAMVFAAVAASSALANTGQINISCTDVTFSFASFPTSSSTINYTIKVDGATASSGSFEIVGPSATKMIANQVPAGTHTVNATASWTVDDGGSIEKTETVTCAPPPSCPAGTKPINDNPLICLKETTVEKVVEVPVEKIVEKPVEKIVYGNPICPAGTTQSNKGDGFVVCSITNNITHEVIKYKTITKVKNHVIVKWKTKVVPCKKKPVPTCPKGTVLFHTSSGWKCGIPGSG